jgi:undecaprenyl diphosphate synthase
MIDQEKLPRHIAIIMDGNGRWATKRNLPRTWGHKAGAETLRLIVQEAGSINIKAITAYAFSTENWKRPKYEVSFLMNLLDVYLAGEIDSLHEEHVRIMFSGELAVLPAKVRARAENAVRLTARNEGLILNLAVNYGAQTELIRAVKLLFQDFAGGQYDAAELTTDLFSRYLYTAELPELDLLIRTGGDMRVSNFLLWQLAYAELWFTDKFWPDFTLDDFYAAIGDFQRRDRRFGGLGGVV